MENFSRKLSHTLDHLGYNHDMVQFRRRRWSHIMSTESNNDVEIILAGSKSEGTTSFYESDFDMMALNGELLCIYTADQRPSQLSGGLPVFLADMDNVPPGYTRLKLYRPSSIRNLRNIDIYNCLVEKNGEFYLSSTFWTSLLKNSCKTKSDGFKCLEVKGPALPANSDQVEIDMVAGITCNYPQLLEAWSSRRRQHEWPSDDTIRTACSFLPQVVPVGAKGSDRQDQEWRFCFIESELILTHSLNGTQIKLFIVLKMISKQILKVVADEISSYVMKNVTYWICELLPSGVFKEEKLAWLVLVGLATLRSAITRWQNLPYYMIPSRNLLLERLDENTQSKLSDLLWMLIREGPLIFLRLDKLRKCMDATDQIPSNMVELGNIRDQIEMMLLAGDRSIVNRVTRVDKALHDLVVSYKRLQDPTWSGELNDEEVKGELRSILS